MVLLHSKKWSVLWDEVMSHYGSDENTSHFMAAVVNTGQDCAGRGYQAPHYRWSETTHDPSYHFDRAAGLGRYRNCRVLFVNLASMRDPRHVHCFGCVIYLVHDAVIADADSPLPIVADKFFASRRPGNRGEPLHARRNPGNHSRGQPLSFFFGARGKREAVASHAAACRS
jgi:hypothetical protein